MNQKARQLIFFVAGLIVSIGFDQWTKALAVAKLKGKEPFVLIDGVFEFFYSENRKRGKLCQNRFLHTTSSLINCRTKKNFKFMTGQPQKKS